MFRLDAGPGIASRLRYTARVARHVAGGAGAFLFLGRTDGGTGRVRSTLGCHRVTRVGSRDGCQSEAVVGWPKPVLASVVLTEGIYCALPGSVLCTLCRSTMSAVNFRVLWRRRA